MDGYGIVRALFPEWTSDPDAFWNAAFELGYLPHGGSGLRMGLDEILSLPIDRIEWYLERLDERRQAEAAQIRKARSD
jgi:hypothetical protein